MSVVESCLWSARDGRVVSSLVATTMGELMYAYNTEF